MPSNPFLKYYADKYRKFYKDKDYPGEALFLHKIFKKHGVVSVLDMACGTGEHLKQLNQLGAYSLIGQDRSEAMLSIAKEKTGIFFFKGEMQGKWKYGQPFDAIICMFSAFDYLLTDEDIEKTLDNVYNNLTDNGLFIFDFWNKACVENHHSPIRENSCRRSYTTLIGNDTAKVEMHFRENEDKPKDMKAENLKGAFKPFNHKETHLLRYHSPETIARRLSNFEIKMFPFMQPRRKITETDWNIQVICSLKRQ